MNTRLRVAAALVAVVVVALVAINLLPSTNSVGGPPSTAPSPSPIALPSADPSGNPASLNPGTYVAGDPFPVRITFRVPAGWEGVVAGPNLILLDQPHGSGGSLAFSLFQTLFANPCHYSGNGLLNPQPGPTVDNMATALSQLPGLTATAPTDVTLGGYQGKQLTLTAPASFAACTLTPDGAFRLWQLPLGATQDLDPGEIDRVWILQVGSQRLEIDATQTSGEFPTDIAEIQGVLDSVQLAPPSPGSSATASSTP